MSPLGHKRAQLRRIGAKADLTRPTQHGCDQQQPSRTMIDVTRETLRTMEQIAERFGRKPKTIRRWAEPVDYKGRPRTNFLETVKKNNRIWTSEEAVNRYFANEPNSAVPSMAVVSEIAATILREQFGLGPMPTK